MTLTSVLVSAGVAALLGLVTQTRARLYLLLGTSILAVYALQPALPVRGLDFWLPTATLALTVFGWVLTTPAELLRGRNTWPAVVMLGTIVLLLGLSRYLPFSLPLTASRPPQVLQIEVVLVLLVLVVSLLGLFLRPGRIALVVGATLVILLFLVLKVPQLALGVSAVLRRLNGQSVQTASALDLRWLGFSYIAFRLLHTLRDRQTGRLPAVPLAEYVVYMLFFPALTAGPIDRIERFLADLNSPRRLSDDDWAEAGKRLLVGLFKKFALADSLALIALNGTNALQVRTTGWAWILLYAYSFQIFLDFSGYTDIAIGLGCMLGIQLPENFTAPYLKPNLTQFWNSWHITLTQWFRSYFFNPLTRFLRSAEKPLPVPLVILVTQVTTMLLIGLWHGVTGNFVLWGLWHGAGLFLQNRWSELTRVRMSALPLLLRKALNAGGILLTFHFVTLGWVFFALPTIGLSWHLFLKLFGLI